MRLPAADELFRRTTEVPEQPSSSEAAISPVAAVPDAPRTPSGRVRHDEKMTVYVTADELLEIEHARLVLRRAGLSVDRGRLVREAVAIALADLDANGDGSVIVHRLMQS